MVTDRGMIEALDHFGQETGDNKALRSFNWNPACPEIEKFVFIDLPTGGAVTATDVVGQDFEAGHGVGLGVVA